MQLHSTITSPYARKVWIVAHETGLISRIERLPTNPHADEYLRTDNPLCRVPTLVLDNGLALFELASYLRVSGQLAFRIEALPAGRGRALGGIAASGPRRWNAGRKSVASHGNDPACQRAISNVDRPTDHGDKRGARLAGGTNSTTGWPDKYWPDRDRVCPWLSRPSISGRALAREAHAHRQMEHNVPGASVNDCDTL